MKKRTSIVVVAGALFGGCADPVGSEPPDSELGQLGQSMRGCSHESRLYTGEPRQEALEQVKQLFWQGEWSLAHKLARVARTPQAIWFASGTPEEVRRDVRRTTKKASSRGQIPVLVAYNLPFRDCSQYSAGGAVDGEAYAAWIEGFAKGIGRREALVILEPDGLGIIPYNHPLHDPDNFEWCQPTVVDASGATVPAPGASPEERYAQLRDALWKFARYAPNAKVYLDASHSAWMSIGEAAHRLFKAGFHEGSYAMHGFFLNVSNYRPSHEAISYGTWVSMCLAAGTPGVGPDWMWDEAAGQPHFDWCGSQYDPATNQVNYSPEFAAEVTEGLLGVMDGAQASLPFVIDTGRNGQGPLAAARYADPPYNQPESVIQALEAGNWCNARGAGSGLLPSLETGIPLVDGYLWIKRPGESDGECNSRGGARAWDFDAYDPWELPVDVEPEFDPLWGRVDPPASKWFHEQAIELAERSNPPLE